MYAIYYKLCLIIKNITHFFKFSDAGPAVVYLTVWIPVKTGIIRARIVKHFWVRTKVNDCCHFKPDAQKCVLHICYK